VELTTQIGESVTDGLAYLGALTSLGGRAAYFTFIAPFQGKPLRLQRAVSQAMQTGVRALPILSLITFFIGLILALQSAYELRKFGALNFVASAVAISMTRELGPLITAIVVNRKVRVGVRCGNRHDARRATRPCYESAAPYFPGWRAEIDGRSEPVVAVDLALMGVMAPARQPRSGCLRYRSIGFSPAR